MANEIPPINPQKTVDPNSAFWAAHFKKNWGYYTLTLILIISNLYWFIDNKTVATTTDAPAATNTSATAVVTKHCCRCCPRHHCRHHGRCPHHHSRHHCQSHCRQSRQPPLPLSPSTAASAVVATAAAAAITAAAVAVAIVIGVVIVGGMSTNCRAPGRD